MKPYLSGYWQVVLSQNCWCNSGFPWQNLYIALTFAEDEAEELCAHNGYHLDLSTALQQLKTCTT